MGSNQGGVGLLERIRVKGRDFDMNGVETPKDELLHMTGLFKLKDVEDRIPIEANRLKYWYSNAQGPYRKCFVKVPMGEKRSLVFVDLQMLNAELATQCERNGNS